MRKPFNAPAALAARAADPVAMAAALAAPGPGPAERYFIAPLDAPPDEKFSEVSITDDEVIDDNFIYGGNLIKVITHAENSFTLNIEMWYSSCGICTLKVNHVDLPEALNMAAAILAVPVR